MSEAIDELMARRDPSMVIVTTVAGEERSGCLVGFHSQCGITPVRYAVWLSKANHTYRVGSLAEVFAVHWIPDDRRDLAELFGTISGDDVDKFARCDWTEGPEGVPLLDGCPDRFAGRRIAWVDAGADHVCAVLDPLDAHWSGERPWLTLHDLDDLDPGHEAEERQPEG